MTQHEDESEDATGWPVRIVMRSGAVVEAVCLSRPDHYIGAVEDPSHYALLPWQGLGYVDWSEVVAVTWRPAGAR
jgi:hypothetical protein